MEKRKGKRAYQMPTGSIPAEISPLFSSDISVSLAHYKRTGDCAHLWRAWLALRAFGSFDQTAFDAVAPLLDELARQQCEGLRADRVERRNWLLLDYYHELSRMADEHPGAADTKAEAMRRVARRKRTTKGAVEQIILEHERRTDRKRR